VITKPPRLQPECAYLNLVLTFFAHSRLISSGHRSVLPPAPILFSRIWTIRHPPTPPDLDFMSFQHDICAVFFSPRSEDGTVVRPVCDLAGCSYRVPPSATGATVHASFTVVPLATLLSTGMISPGFEQCGMAKLVALIEILRSRTCLFQRRPGPLQATSGIKIWEVS